MNLHEYQAKTLLASYGLPVAPGRAVETVDAAVAAAEAFGGGRWAVKAQIHAGGRGKAGGVKLAKSLDEVRAFADAMLGQNLVTIQTDKRGQPVNKVFIECAIDIEAEFYLAAVIDRSSRRITFMASTEGGVDIETVAAETPDKIFRVTVDPLFGALPWQGRRLAFQLGLTGSQIRDFAQMFVTLTDMFITTDCSLLEINPLVVTKKGNLHCLDAKINIDDNALFRHADITAMRDYSQENPQEKQAAQFNLSYVALDGNIGCMVNGAGLAMATMDLVKLEGGEPANFLDVGGGADQQAVAEAFKIILSDSKVKAVFINIFGGIISCVTIADGIIAAIEEIGVKIPVVIRFEGNNAALGLERLQQVQKATGLDIITAEGLTDAARKAVAAAK